jgi:hypothetical protein
LTAETEGLVIPLPAWQLSGSVTEAKTGISVEVPKGATLSAEGDATTGALTANLSIPPINQTISVLGIPITVKVGIGFLKVPIGCTTVEPLQLPLTICEQVNALVIGGLAIKTTTVPEFVGCGLFGPILTATMWGPNNPINITASPPINW